MPEVHHIGSKFYAHRMEYPSKDFPIIDKGSTQEIEWPFRAGTALVVRIPATHHAVVLGRWLHTVDEEQALSTAIGARPYVP